MLIEPYTWTKIAHVLALAGALGGAICADLFLFSQAILRPIQQNVIATARFIGAVVMTGLVVLWSSGIMLVAIAYSKNPGFMLNEKLWVKVFIVVVLSLNAAVIHGVALPTIESQIGQRLFDGLSIGRRLVLASSSAVSTVSWLFLTVLGIAHELDRTTPGYKILGTYYGFLLLAIVPVALFALLTGRQTRRGAQGSSVIGPVTGAVRLRRTPA